MRRAIIAWSVNLLHSLSCFHPCLKMKFKGASFWGALGGATLLALCSNGGGSFADAFNEQEASAFMERFDIPKNHITLEWATSGTGLQVTEVGGIKYKWLPSETLSPLRCLGRGLGFVAERSLGSLATFRVGVSVVQKRDLSAPRLATRIYGISLLAVTALAATPWLTLSDTSVSV